MAVEVKAPDESNHPGALDAIRTAETEAARRIVQAEQHTRLIEEKAQQEAEMRLVSARARARVDAERHLQETLWKAKSESETIIEDAQRLAKQINASGKRRMAAAINHALVLVAGRTREYPVR